MQPIRLEAHSRRRRGIVAVFVAVCLVALLSVAAISVDGGMMFLELRKARATADAAAMAAACDLFKNYPTYSGKDTPGTAKTSALAVASANGYTNDGTISTVTVNIPPVSGIYAGKDSYAEIIVVYNMSTAFGRVLGKSTMPVQARAVSRGAWVSPHEGVLVLDYNDKASLSTQGNGAFTETGGPVIVNSDNSSAVVTTGNGSMIAPEFYVTGGVTLSGNAAITTSPVAGQIFTGTHPTPDPLAYLAPPTKPTDGTMTTTKNPAISDLPPGMASIVTNISSVNTLYVMTPGTYTNLPTFGPGDMVIMEQASANNAGGIYYVNGGGFKSTGASIIMDKNNTGGVMIYNQPASSANSEKIQITGNSSGLVDLSPLSTGPYAGMMLWQDRTSPVDVLVEGNGTFSVKGTFYAADALLNINGNGKTNTGTLTGGYYNDLGVFVSGASQIGSQYVSNNLSLGGNGNIKIFYDGPSTARTRIITLVE
ncbi:MAG: pilus assembly protein TadG-related protein [Gemmataceae bacterium]